MKKDPMLFIATGLPGCGKSTVCREIVEKIDNAVYFDRDDVIWPLMHVAYTRNLRKEAKELPDFRDYIKRDLDPCDLKKDQSTFCGTITKVLKTKSLYYKRHVRYQSLLVLQRLAQRQLVDPFSTFTQLPTVAIEGIESGKKIVG